MHRDTVTHVATATAHDFIVTGSSDGDLRFWKILSVSSCPHLYVSALCLLYPKLYLDIAAHPISHPSAAVAAVVRCGSACNRPVKHEMKQISDIRASAVCAVQLCSTVPVCRKMFCS